MPLDVTDLMSDDLSKSIPSAHLFEFQKSNSGVIKKLLTPEKSIPRLTIHLPLVKSQSHVKLIPMGFYVDTIIFPKCSC